MLWKSLQKLKQRNTHQWTFIWDSRVARSSHPLTGDSWCVWLLSRDIYTCQSCCRPAIRLPCGPLMVTRFCLIPEGLHSWPRWWFSKNWVATWFLDSGTASHHAVVVVFVIVAFPKQSVCLRISILPQEVCYYQLCRAFSYIEEIKLTKFFYFILQSVAAGN